MTAIVLNSDAMGHGDDALGKKLMGAYLKKLWVKIEKPEVIILYNSGVKLVSKEGGQLEAMVGLEEAGVEIIACGTCLDHYGLMDSIGAGRVSNMEEIVATMDKANKVITI